MRVQLKKQARKLFLIILFLFSCSYVFSSFFIAPYKDEIVLSNYFRFALDFMFPEDNSCYLDADDSPVQPRNFSEQTIFFIETTCKRGLTIRKACALEAAVMTHPLRTVALLSTSALKEIAYRRVLGSFNFRNLVIHRIHVEEYTKDTPLEEFFKKRIRRLMKKHRIIEELLKFTTMYKFGGITMDLNMILTNRVEKFSNWFVKEKNMTLSTAIMGSEKYTGKKIFESALNLLKSQKSLNESSGKLVLNAALKQLCHSINMSFCSEIHTFDSRFFFPINQTNKDLYYKPGELLEESQVHGYHLWDCSDRRRYVAADSLFVKISRKYCPLVFRKYIINFIRF